MNIVDLPYGERPVPLGVPHFPTPQQAVVWRNWELVPVQRLARVLGTTAKRITELAQGMGLRVPSRVNKAWLTSGYCTIIRNNWHLLPYDQLLVLLGWTAEHLDFILREEDFLWVKLGLSKPNATRIAYAPLNAEQLRATRLLRQEVQRGLSGARRVREEPAFAFLKSWKKAPRLVPRPAIDAQAQLRLMYPFSATYGDSLSAPGLDSYPEGLLAAYAANGVNAIWLQGILYTLFPWAAFPELATGWEIRLESLRRLVRRAARYGISVYLYLNEPRGLSVSMFGQRPDLLVRDCNGISPLCTSLPEIQRFLHDGARHVFTQVPDLAGFFTITMNENPSSCVSRWHARHNCPRCSQRSYGKVIGEVNRLLVEGARSAKPIVHAIAWSWGWDPSFEMEVVDNLPAGMDLMCVSEWGMNTTVGGIANTVADYTISQVGPSDQSLKLWQRAKARGLGIIAKIQVNSSWELSCVPWLPVPDLVEKHLGRLRTVGIDGYMLGWTVGGYPGGNLRLLDQSRQSLAADVVGSSHARLLCQAWTAFSTAFAELPLSCPVLYHSPLNVGPANLLHLIATGRKATMVLGFPYDDLAGWRDIYPADMFEAQLRWLSEGWKKGLVLLRRLIVSVSGQARQRVLEHERMALVGYAHFRSTYLQVRFIRLRDGGGSAQAMRAVIREELDLARILHDIVRADSRIGFEAANHYAYTVNDLAEKVLHCAWLLRQSITPQSVTA